MMKVTCRTTGKKNLICSYEEIAMMWYKHDCQGTKGLLLQGLIENAMTWQKHDYQGTEGLLHQGLIDKQIDIY